MRVPRISLGKLFNVLQSPIGRMASWPMRNIYTFPSKQMYPYLSLVERKEPEFFHNVDSRRYLVWFKCLIFIAFPGQFMVALNIFCPSLFKCAQNTFCEFCSNRIPHYFPLSASQSVCQSVTGVTTQLFLIIWWFKAWKPYIFWKHIMWPTWLLLPPGHLTIWPPDHLNHPD